jgi:hypothetical protein
MHGTNRFEPRFFSEKARQISSPRLRPKLHSIPPLSLATPEGGGFQQKPRGVYPVSLRLMEVLS